MRSPTDYHTLNQNVNTYMTILSLWRWVILAMRSLQVKQSLEDLIAEGYVLTASLNYETSPSLKRDLEVHLPV